jgi:hypothetical protein
MWEYKIETLSLGYENIGLGLNGAVVTPLNKWGGEGWELVALMPHVWGIDQCPALIFKRPTNWNAGSN